MHLMKLQNVQRKTDVTERIISKKKQKYLKISTLFLTEQIENPWGYGRLEQHEQPTWPKRHL